MWHTSVGRWLLEHGPSTAELLAQRDHPPVVAWVRKLSEWLREAIDASEARAAEVGRLAFEDAEETMVASVGAADPDLVEAGHVTVPGVPLPSARERGWWSLGHRVEHRGHFGARPYQQF